MKQLLITAIAAVVLVGCATTQEPEPSPAKAPDISINQAVFDGNIEAVKQHLAAGTDVNAKDDNGWIPLHFAVYYGHKEIVELLIAKGAEVNAKDGGGRTPLNSGTWFRGNKETVELLIAAGADVKAGDGLKRTPLDWAVAFDQTEIADLFRKCGGKTREELKAERK